MLEKLLIENESKTLEFKEYIKAPLNLIKTIIAFTNTAGGTIVIGVRDKNKEIIGVKDILNEEERLANIIADSIEPLLIPDIEITTFRNRELLIIKVPHFVGPYYIKNLGLDKGTYIRLGSTNRLADIETLESLKRLTKNISFDELPCIGANISELNKELIESKFKAQNQKISSAIYNGLCITVIHLNKTYPSNGAMLLFSKQRNKYFPDTIIRCACFKGTDKSYIIDQKDIENELLIAIDEIVAFINRHSNIGAEIGKLERKDIYQYPAVAIRETILNAILHADYSIKGANIQIAIFSDRIEVTNPGALPFGQTIEAALSGISRLRNRIIGRVFRKLKLIEQLGSGMQRIVGSYKELGAKTPLFEEINNYFRVTLFPVTEKNMSALVEGWQEQLIFLLQKKKQLKTKDIAIFWNVTTRTARTRLQSMQSLGLIKKIGTAHKDPNAVYVLAKTQKN